MILKVVLQGRPASIRQKLWYTSFRWVGPERWASLSESGSQAALIAVCSFIFQRQVWSALSVCRLSTWEFAYYLKIFANHSSIHLVLWRSFVDKHRVATNLICSLHVYAAEVEQGGSLLTCFCSHTINEWDFFVCLVYLMRCFSHFCIFCGDFTVSNRPQVWCWRVVYCP